MVLLGKSDLNHLHVMVEFGLAAVSLHFNAAASSSLTGYKLGVIDVTSGLSITSSGIIHENKNTLEYFLQSADNNS